MLIVYYSLFIYMNILDYSDLIFKQSAKFIRVFKKTVKQCELVHAIYTQAYKFHNYIHIHLREIEAS